MSWPAATSAARSSIRMPATRSVVSTPRPVRRQSTRGTRKPGSPAKFSASSDAAAASNRRSISISTDFSRVRAISTGFSRRRAGCVRSISRPSHIKRSRSRAKARAIPGRRILTATSLPSLVTAKCTCAIEAAATGTSSNARNRLSTGQPNSASIEARASRVGNGGSRSCSSARSAATSSPSRSARVASIWPSLINAGPISWNAAARRWPGRAVPPRRRTSLARRSNGIGPASGSIRNSASCRASVTAMAARRVAWRRLRKKPNTQKIGL